MGSASLVIRRDDCITVPDLALTGVWLAGVALGLLAACFYGASFSALAADAGSTALTFANACVAAMLPLLLTAAAVFFFHRVGVFLACGLRGLCIGFSLGCAVSAGGLWLGGLLMFSGLMTAPGLLWFCHRRLRRGMDSFYRDGLICLGVDGLICAVDTWVAAPFLAAALSF